MQIRDSKISKAYLQTWPQKHTIRLKLNNSLRNVIIIYIITFINSAACVIFGCSNIKADK